MHQILRGLAFCHARMVRNKNLFLEPRRSHFIKRGVRFGRCCTAT
jgi:hypothetical protein